MPLQILFCWPSAGLPGPASGQLLLFRTGTINCTCRQWLTCIVCRYRCPAVFLLQTLRASPAATEVNAPLCSGLKRRICVTNCFLSPLLRTGKSPPPERGQRFRPVFLESAGPGSFPLGTRTGLAMLGLFPALCEAGFFVVRQPFFDVLAAETLRSLFWCCGDFCPGS